MSCTGARVSQGNGGYKLEGDFIAASSLYVRSYPISVKHFTPLGCIMASEILKSSPVCQFECLYSRQKETSEHAEELLHRSFTSLTLK